MDHRHLEYFVAIADAGSFTRAAQLAGTTQPTMSATVRRLERELGTSLFERGTRALTLSPAGATFLPHAREVLVAVEEARAAVSTTDTEPTGEVRMGSVISPLGLDVVRFLARFRRDHPRVTPRLVTRRTPEELIDDVRQGRIDLALTVTLDPDASPPGVELVVLHSEPFVLQVAPDHPLAARDMVTVDQVRDLPFVCFPTNSSQRPGMDGVFARIGLAPKVAFECDAPAHLRLVLDAGVCCLGLADRTASIEPAIRNIPFDIETPHAYVALARPETYRRSSPARAVADALLEALGHPDPRGGPAR